MKQRVMAFPCQKLSFFEWKYTIDLLIISLWSTLITLLFTAEQRDEWDSTGQIAYEKACKKYGVIVSSTFHNKLRYANSIDLGYYGVGVAGAKAIAVAFCVSIVVELLDVETLGLGREGLGLERSCGMWSYFLCTYSRQLSTQATILWHKLLIQQFDEVNIYLIEQFYTDIEEKLFVPNLE